ncbi:MAG TPA: aldo/keto reductase, partial [Steroidobacteraceae bacterium]|nr:aldo/keto reductase [Steroidobacteraceae bacterium]
MMAAAAATRAVAADSADKLIARKIPSSGEELPVIGLGTSGPFEVGTASADRVPLRAVLTAFFAAGARLIDTSPMYSTAEGVLGDLLTPDMHAHAFIATKVWTRGAQSGIEQMTHSSQLMKHPRLDLIQ